VTLSEEIEAMMSECYDDLQDNPVLERVLDMIKQLAQVVEAHHVYLNKIDNRTKKDIVFGSAGRNKPRRL